MNGIINVYKEKDYTSFDVCALLRGILKTKKVGHTGTLDPNAEGVLPVCIGNATKLCDFFTDKEKEYVAEFELGKRTDTLDIWGEVLEKREPVVSVEELKNAILSFTGGYEQVPPMYSAKKVNGQKLYDMARDGKTIERKPVFVDIKEIGILDISYPKAKIRVRCGKGTYIRSLCEDIGKKCGELAYMTSLIRTRVSGFSIDSAVKLSDITRLRDEGRIEEYIMPVDDCFKEYPKLTVKPEFRKLIDNGNKLFYNMVDGDFSKENGTLVRIYNNDDIFTGIFVVNVIDKTLKPFKMFMGE
ncbi:MAG: tRNA pseudouridine(55) synthase TruB [Lachnospiraceae bacterium]|nr:tRNA pseudouridine(55) synthase TruB [Lachnospiraceae bacterium]